MRKLTDLYSSKQMITKFFAKASLTLGALLLWLQADAQCAMCRAVAEESLYDDSWGFAMGLNAGIIMLMLVPYILLSALLYFFFRKQIAGFLRSFNDIH